MATVAPESAMNGLDPMFNPEWFFTSEQLGLLERLREICVETIRPLAAENDRTLTFPRKSLEALGPDGFLGLMLPKEWGGLGQNHVMYAAVTETIARYGDASCAMCYVMHIGAVEALKLRATDYTIEKYLKKVREGKLGTLSYSDPETGSHFWYPIASGARRADGGFEVLKKASWTTSAGFADFYVLQTTSPDYSGDYSNLSVFVVDAADIQAKPEEWDAMGLRGNQSGSLLLDWKFVPEQQLVGPVGDGANSNDESVDPNFLVGSSGTWNGISLGAIDIAIRHTTRKTHKDVGLRVCDYPTIQDAVGEAIMDTNASRMFVFSVAQALDKVTDGSQTNPRGGRARPRQLPALAVADQVQRGQERRPRGRQDAALLRRHRLQEGAAAARALPARRQGRLGDGADQRGAAPVRRQDRAPGDGVARLLEPGDQPAGAPERVQEDDRRPEARAGRAAAGRGRRVGQRRLIAAGDETGPALRGAGPLGASGQTEDRRLSGGPVRASRSTGARSWRPRAAVRAARVVPPRLEVSSVPPDPPGGRNRRYSHPTRSSTSMIPPAATTSKVNTIHFGICRDYHRSTAGSPDWDGRRACRPSAGSSPTPGASASTCHVEPAFASARRYRRRRIGRT